MSRFRSVLLSVAAVGLLAGGCDGAEPVEPLDEPGPDTYTLSVETDDVGYERRATGRVRYVRTDLPRLAGHRVADLTLLPERPGAVRGSLALYVSQDGADLYPAPGVYDVADPAGAPYVLQVEVEGRTFTAYRGSLTVETASETAFVGRLDVQITTGGCALFPTCEGPTRTGVLRARVRASAEPGAPDPATAP